ncbi:MAG: hypothetical protein M5U34_21915 [Chloroflexi bacterium]|nr:hypothetical protein [Chloroflexota bacterium]
MSNSAEIELTQLKTAVHYFISLLEEGSLVKNYDETTRNEIAQVLDLLVEKVGGLPEGVPENLVQAAWCAPSSARRSGCASKKQTPASPGKCGKWKHPPAFTGISWVNGNRGLAKKVWSFR